MHKQRRAQDANELRQWTSNKAEFQPPYKESPAILIQMLLSDYSPARRIIHRRLMATWTRHQVLGGEVVETSEIMISSAILRPGPWATASCTRTNGIDIRRQSPELSLFISRRRSHFPSAVPEVIASSGAIHAAFDALASSSLVLLT